MVYDEGGSRLTKNVPVGKARQQVFCLTDEQVFFYELYICLFLGAWTCALGRHHWGSLFSKTRELDSHGHRMELGTWQLSAYLLWPPQDGHTNDLFIVQARPETVQSQRTLSEMVTYSLKGGMRVFVSHWHLLNEMVPTRNWLAERLSVRWSGLERPA